MKIDLIGMILNSARHGTFDGAIVDDNGRELDAAHSLDYMIMEYAKVKSGGTSNTVAVRDLDPNLDAARCSTLKEQVSRAMAEVAIWPESVRLATEIDLG